MLFTMKEPVGRNVVIYLYGHGTILTMDVKQNQFTTLYFQNALPYLASLSGLFYIHAFQV